VTLSLRQDIGRATARGARATEWRVCRELATQIGYQPEVFDVLTLTDPDHVPDYVRVVDIDGRPVSLAVVVPRRIKVAGVSVEGVILTLVGTHPGFRGGGLTAMLLEDTMVFVRSRGFRVALVDGTPDFYRRFGFVPCFGAYSVEFSSARALAGERHSPVPGTGRPAVAADSGRQTGGGGHWRPMEAPDTSAVTALYEGSLACTSCAVLRPREPWAWSGAGGRDIHVLERGPEIVGYVRLSSRAAAGAGDPLSVAEVGGSSAAVIAEALRWMSRRGEDSGRKHVVFTGPPDHPFARLACVRAAGTVRVEAARTGQLAVTNRGLLMADIVSSLSDRAGEVGLPPGARIVLDVGEKRVDLSAAGGRVRLLGGRAGRQAGVPVTRLSLEAFTYLVTGYAGAGEVAGLPGVSLVEEHREALAALFPTSYPVWTPAPYWSDEGWRPNEDFF